VGERKKKDCSQKHTVGFAYKVKAISQEFFSQESFIKILESVSASQGLTFVEPPK